MARRKELNESTSSAEQRSEHASEQDTKQDRGTSGRGWHGDPQGHANAGSKGGRSVSQIRDHMPSIGRKGGQAVSRDRRHMAEIGRKGGQARGESNSGAEGERSEKNK